MPLHSCTSSSERGPMWSSVFSPTNRTRHGPSWSCTALDSLSSSTGRGCQGKSRHSGSFSTSTRPCRVIMWPSASNRISVGIPRERGGGKKRGEDGVGGRQREEGKWETVREVVEVISLNDDSDRSLSHGDFICCVDVFLTSCCLSGDRSLYSPVHSHFCCAHPSRWLSFSHWLQSWGLINREHTGCMSHCDPLCACGLKCRGGGRHELQGFACRRGGGQCWLVLRAFRAFLAGEAESQLLLTSSTALCTHTEAGIRRKERGTQGGAALLQRTRQ